MVVVLHRAISCCNFTYDRLMRRRCAAFPAGERGDEIVFAYAARGRSLSSSAGRLVRCRCRPAAQDRVLLSNSCDPCFTVKVGASRSSAQGLRRCRRSIGPDMLNIRRRVYGIAMNATCCRKFVSGRPTSSRGRFKGFSVTP